MMRLHRIRNVLNSSTLKNSGSKWQVGLLSLLVPVLFWGMSFCFMSLAADPQSEHVVHGMKIHGELKMRDGGEIKLY